MLKPRILVADDHALVLEGSRRILEERYELSGWLGMDMSFWLPRRPCNPTS